MTDTEKLLTAKKWLGIIIDAAVNQGNGESIVPNEDLEDAKKAVFGVQDVALICARCEHTIPDGKAEQVGLVQYCSGCAKDYQDDALIEAALQQQGGLPC